MSTVALLAITESALARVRAFRDASPDPSSRVLSVRVSGSADGEYTHALTLDAANVIRSDGAVQHEEDVTIVVPAESIAKLRGATLDWLDDPPPGGFTVRNPNRPAPPPLSLPSLPLAPGVGPRTAAQPAPMPPTARNLDTDIATRVRAVLDEAINPSIASHGGHAELAGIEGRVAYLRLGGGCQGCGMASVTLSQGIEVAITDAVPEIIEVVDVTDHASGSNPYFEPAKK